ncbi:bifunctional diguanylate cyclase/phosphodiesterase [Martelella radicis]|uniref:Diguanylate cyclase (GGDEF)-like protein/PAS domain S-box-containing protein n=1 Tax=Martelella radicis TaxID=1397476 RepID=A0A7W6KLF1_9HYPH|nr:EAL domain-containing protein [Martelella radicis]MBB4123453.1 diguanylate cyclase (GGDEF)-like protein/PAS domain S-box-containing protein [Martelella radicis]
MLKPEKRRPQKRFWLIPSDLLALAVVTLVLGSMLLANRQAERNFTQNLRLKTSERMAVSTSQLEADLEENLKLVEGLGLALSIEPEIDANRFGRLADKLIEGHNAIASIALARDLKITMVYPLEENSEAIGLDYRDRPEQLAAIQKALLQRGPVVDGPIPLVQGGSALLAYYPLFDGEESQVWGLLSAIVDLEDLLADRTITERYPDLELALAKNDAGGSPVEVLFGPPSVFEADPVTQPIDLANTQWTLAAAPRTGWTQPARMAVPRQVLIGTIGFVIIAAVAGIAHLLRLRLHTLTKLGRLSRRMQLALDTSKIGVWEMDVASGEAIWDQRMYTLYGRTPDCAEAPMQIWFDRLHPDDRQKERARMEITVAEGKEFRNTFRIVMDDGDIRHMQAFGAFFRDPGGNEQVVGVNWDITEDVRLHEDLKRANVEARQKNQALEEAQKVLRHNALHDALTGLANRRYLAEAFSDRKKGQSPELTEPPYAVLHIDIDRFKEINDTLGHAAGDAMLRHSANMLRSIAGSRDFLARIGGDEFTLVTHWNGDVERLTRLAQEIIRALGRPLNYGEHQVRVSASVGIAWMDEDTVNMRDALVNAGIALYEAKRMGRNQFVIFDATLRNIAITNKKVADELLAALEDDQFEVFYQPQISARTLEIQGVEALVRWRHPTRGQLAPSHFIGTAETTGSIARIDAVVLKKASAQFQAWRQDGIALPHISVNISAQRLIDPALLQSIAESQLDPGQLCIELLESISFDDQDTSLETAVSAIKSLGVDVEIDDFGTGYASILSLLSLSPKRLKIDRQLVLPITTGQSQRRLVASIVEIGKALGIEVIAEGVETAEHVRILRELGVDSFQGYFFAPPLSGNALESFVRERGWFRCLGEGPERFEDASE